MRSIGGCTSQRYIPGDWDVLTCVRERHHRGSHRDPSGKNWCTGEIFPGFAKLAREVPTANDGETPADAAQPNAPG